MKTIDDVLERLDDIIALCAREKRRAGYFAALYRHTTANVKLGIEQGLFEDGARMEQLDVVFAGRYIDAFDAYWAGNRPTAAWDVAFRAADRGGLAIVQHLLLGMNAHINLDLGIAAASVAPGGQLPGLQNDFMTINRILASMVGQVMQEIDEVSPWFSLMNKLAGKSDQAVVNFSIDVARDQAWAFARKLAPLDPSQQEEATRRRDKEMALFADLIRDPGLSMTVATRLIALREVKDVRRVIAVLATRLQAVAHATLGRVAQEMTAAAQDPSRITGGGC